MKVTADFFENQLYTFRTFTETAERLVLKTKLVKDQMDIYTSASTYVCFMHLWSLLTATVVYRCTCMYRRFLFLNLHAHPNNNQFWKMKLVSAVRHIWHNHFPCIISLMNNKNKACLKHAECLILLQQDDNEDGTNFIHIFVVAYNLIWCHPKVSFYQIQWNTHFFGEWSFLNHSRSLNQDSKDVTLYYFNT